MASYRQYDYEKTNKVKPADLSSPGKEPVYEKWRRDDLYHLALRAGIEGRAEMTKEELVRAIRDHIS